MNTIPNELKLQILHHHRGLLPDPPFTVWPIAVMEHDEAYYDLLLDMALLHREWTALAQSELFHRIILVDEFNTELLLKLVRENQVFADYAKSAKSVRFGRRYDPRIGAWLKDSVDELASYCPEIVELSCSGVGNVRLEYFQAMKKLDKLNLRTGSLLRPSSSMKRPNSSLPITRLTISRTSVDSLALDPASLPFVRSLRLRLDQDTLTPSHVSLFPQLTSLTLAYQPYAPDLNTCLAATTALTSLSLAERNISDLDTAGLLMIKQKIRTLEVWQSYEGEEVEVTGLIEIIEGSEVMKKVILNGQLVSATREAGEIFVEMVEALKVACATKGVELWKENFATINGQVNLAAEE